MRQKVRAGVFLTERGKQVELRHVFQRELRKVDARVHLDARDEFLWRKLVHVRAQALRELGELCRRKRYAHGSVMAAEAREDVLAGGNRVEKVHIAHAAARAMGLIAFDGEENGGNAVAVGEARGDDALHAFMPALARNHQRTLALEDALSLLGGNLGKLRFDGAALGVHVLKLGGKMRCLSKIIAKKQVKRQLSVTHTPCRVQARDDGEAQAGRGNGLVGKARSAQKRCDARARVLVDHAHTRAHQSAVLAAHGHKVGNSAKRRQIYQLAPQIRLAEPGANRLHHLQRHPRACKNRAGVVVALRVNNRHANRHKIGRLVMIGDNHIDAALFEDLDLVLGGDAVVYRNHQIGVAGRRSIDGRLRKAVPFLETERDERSNAGAAFAQTARHKRGGGNAIEVEVAEHQDVLAVLDGCLDAVYRRLHVLYFIRIRPIPLKRRVQELLGLFNRIEPASHQGGGNELRQVKFGCKTRSRSRIGRGKINARTHSNTY